MGQPAARIDDYHTCPMFIGLWPHVGGPIISGFEQVKIGGKPAARRGDQASCSGPVDVIQTGSTSVSIGGQPAARVNDTTVHGGIIMTGSDKVNIGG
jgi:uncharacterized Zn-binding protein involved in type VI secretion